MKFTCESCSAQYMISDEKVGPSGVKVRCKKCGNVILVRRGAPAPALETAATGAESAAQAAAAPGPAAGGGGLDAELGQAFDQAFGDTPTSTPAPAAGADMAATQLMGSEDAAKVFADKGGQAPPASEWYVAIGQAQVGPLPLAEVKKKWEAGDVGPDSLVWRPGMGDWTPLTTVAELAGYLAPVPRAAAQPARAAEPRGEPAARADPTPPAAEPTWKPVGASALAALASEEIAARAAPEPKPAARPVQGVKSLVDALPDGGGVDPTGALPLNIKALEPTGEKKIERRTSVARGAEQARRRSTARAVVVGVAVGAVVVAGAAVGGPYVYRKYVAPPPPAVAARPAIPLPPPPVIPAPPAAAPAAGAPQPVAAVAPPAPAAPAETPPPAAAAPAEPSAAKEPPARADRPPRNGARAARAEATARKEPPRKEPPRVASAQPTPPPAQPARKKGDSLLDFEGNDKALDDALGGGGGSSSRSVYVPPARAGEGALPDKVSPGDINAAVAQRIDALRRCVSEQKAREPDASGTLRMRWIIQGDGSVRDVKCLTAEYAQGAFAQCIGGVVRTIRFPRSTTSGQEVTFPFNF
jgi:predicted Zn finger-like uncharacterized protein